MNLKMKKLRKFINEGFKIINLSLKYYIKLFKFKFKILQILKFALD